MLRLRPLCFFFALLGGLALLGHQLAAESGPPRAPVLPRSLGAPQPLSSKLIVPPAAEVHTTTTAPLPVRDQEAPAADGESAPEVDGTPETGAAASKKDPRRVKYVLLFIADGMGLALREMAEQVQAHRLGASRPPADAEDPRAPALAMNRLPVQGITTTHASDAPITDSAAAGTALACGVKTANGMLGMTPDGAAYANVADLAAERGMRTGVVSTVPLDHATPAAFYARNRSRGNYWQIAMDLAASPIDYAAGGGIYGASEKKRRLPGTETLRADPMPALKKAGFQLVRGGEALAACEPGARVLAIDPRLDTRDTPSASPAMVYAIDRDPRAGGLSLADYTREGIRLLDNPKGFFLMVEGGKIDWACHANDLPAAVGDMLEFDAAVAVGVAFAAKHPDETLLIVVSDHETGGLALGAHGAGSLAPDYLANRSMSGQAYYRDQIAPFLQDAVSFEDLVRLVADGPLPVRDGAAELLPAAELARLRAAWTAHRRGARDGAQDEDTKAIYGTYPPLQTAVCHLMSARAGCGWTTFGHTGVTTPSGAMGPGAESLAGRRDNTDVAKTIATALGAADFPRLQR